MTEWHDYSLATNKERFTAVLERTLRSWEKAGECACACTTLQSSSPLPAPA